MADDKPRLARLTAIATQLQSKRMITARDIADKHQVSIRTVYRDMRTLEKSGIPIITEEGRGYRLLEGYRLPPVSFTEDEANAIITSGEIIKRNTDDSLTQHYQSALIKIKSVMRPSQKQKTELLENRLQIRDNPENHQASNLLSNIQSALTDFQIVKINYLSLDNKESDREIEPFAMFSTNGNWILIAFCRLRGDFRAFRLDCIRSMKVTEKKFEPHPMTLEEYFENCRKNRRDP